MQQAALLTTVANCLTAAVLCACCTAQAACSCLLRPLLPCVQSAADKIPWKLILSKRAVWALILSHFCHNWGTFILLTWMPTYYNQVRPACKGYLPSMVSCLYDMKVCCGCMVHLSTVILLHGDATDRGSLPLALQSVMPCSNFAARMRLTCFARGFVLP